MLSNKKFARASLNLLLNEYEQDSETAVIELDLLDVIHCPPLTCILYHLTAIRMRCS